MQAYKRIDRARQKLIIRYPFFGVLASRLIIKEWPECETMATDGKHLFFNISFVDTLSDPELMGVVAHETLHCSNQHFARLQGRNHNQFNVAADYAINPIVIKAGLELPNCALMDSQFTGLGAEEIYSIREGQKQPQEGQPGNPGSNGQPGDESQSAGNSGQSGDDSSQSNDGQPGDSGQAGDGQSTGGNQSASDPGGCGGFIMPESGNDESSAAAIGDLAQQWEIATRQAAMIAAKQAGDMPGYIQDILDQLNQPVFDWRAALFDWINDKVAVDYSWSRPNKRFAHTGIILPSPCPDGIEHIVFCVDTSGSMDKAALNACFDEIAGLLESGFVRRLTVIQTDTRVNKVRHYYAGELPELDIYGRGGTDFRDAMAMIADDYQDASGLIVFTDLGITQEHCGQDPNLPVIWAVTGNSREFETARNIPLFGECIHLAA